MSPEQKSPFLLKARENRTNLRQKKAQQVSITIYAKCLLRENILCQEPYHNGIYKPWTYFSVYPESLIIILFSRKKYTYIYMYIGRSYILFLKVPIPKVKLLIGA